MGVWGGIRWFQERCGQCYSGAHGPLQVIAGRKFKSFSIKTFLPHFYCHHQKFRNWVQLTISALMQQYTIHMQHRAILCNTTTDQVSIPRHVGNTPLRGKRVRRVVDMWWWHEAAPVLSLLMNSLVRFLLLNSSNVCAARYSGVISYKHSSTKVVSGCTQKPSPGDQVSWLWAKFVWSW